MSDIDADILAKTMRHRGYRGWRIRPHPYNQLAYLAETYQSFSIGPSRKGWKALKRETRQGIEYRMFESAEQAYAALVEQKREEETWKQQREDLS